MPWIKDGCIGCTKCEDVCPAAAIDMIGEIAVIDQRSCTDCGKCIHVCPVDIIRPNYEKNANREQKWFDE